MTTSLVDAESLLALDIGVATTRASLFDVADGRYRFIAQGQAPTTAGAPFKDLLEGIRLAVERLEEVTGRTLNGTDDRLLVPSLTDGSGVDRVVATLSVGDALSTVVVGLLDDVSLESAHRLVNTSYTRLTESIGLNDRRKMEAQVDAILQASPQVIVVAGGTEGGATRSVMKLIELVGVACYLTPQVKRPEVLYTGNQVLAEKVKASLGNMVALHISDNIRPAFDHEDLEPAQQRLSEIVTVLRERQIGGAGELHNLTNGAVMPSAQAFGRMVRYMSKVDRTGKGVLGVDLGAQSTVLAVALLGRLTLNVIDPLGVGEGLASALEQIPLPEIIQWLPLHVSEDVLRDYLWNKTLHPAMLPESAEDLAMEQALTRALMRTALKKAAQSSPNWFTHAGGLKSPFEPIVASGAPLANNPTPGQSMLILLDSLQPVGVTTIALDTNNLTASLGAASSVNTLLPVQVIETGAYMNLGTVITPVSDTRYGNPLMRVRLTPENGTELSAEIKQGSLVALPLARGQVAKLSVEPLTRVDTGLGKMGRGSLKVVGGVCGVVIDARGRPLVMPPDAPRRRDLMKKWLFTLGG
jgi:hypothetical protein